MTNFKGDYYEGLEEGWVAGSKHEKKIWEQAVTQAIGYIPRHLLEEVDKVRSALKEAKE